jgi:hypothetical protein
MSSSKTRRNAGPSKWFRARPTHQGALPRWNNQNEARICLIGRGPSDDSDLKMRLLLAIIVIIYLVGVGTVLSPIIRSTWNSEPASVLAERVIQALPDAFTWPLKAAQAFAGS